MDADDRDAGADPDDGRADGSDDSLADELLPEQDEPGPSPPAAAWERLRRRVVASGRETPFVPETETVVIDVRQHPVALVPPLARLVVTLLVLATGFALLPVLLLAALSALWAHTRLVRRAKGMAVTAAVVVGGLLLLSRAEGPAVALLVGLLLLGWVGDEVGDWWHDRLVVSDRRIYRRYGFLTRHSPSIALTAVAFIDAAVPPLGRALGYGTLRLDSVAQRDAPLSRFDRVPDVVAVHHRVLQLRSSAMPRFPNQPH